MQLRCRLAYFKLKFEPRDILAYFKASLQKRALNFPAYSGELDRLKDLKQRIEESLPRLSLTSEATRREFLIAPVLMDILHYMEATLSVEYAIVVSDQLKGSLDYRSSVTLSRGKLKPILQSSPWNSPLEEIHDRDQSRKS